MKKALIHAAALFWVLPFLLATALAATGEELPFALDAAAALLMDAGTGQVIMQKNADEPLPAASAIKDRKSTRLNSSHT